jgi:hypothetical protein
LKHVSEVMTETSIRRKHKETFPLRRIGKGCSHSNERQIREVGTLGDGDLCTVLPKPTSGTDRLQDILESRTEQ